MKMNTTTRLFLMFLVLVISGCSERRIPSQVNNLDQVTKPHYIRPVLPPGVSEIPTEASISESPTKERQFYSVGFELNNEVGLPDRLGGVYWTDPQHPLSATFTFHNNTLRNRDLNLLCLVDYHQVPCTPDRRTLSVIVPSGERSEIALKLPGLSRGMHRISVVAVPYIPVPEHIVKDQQRLGDLIIHSAAWPASLTVYAGDEATPELSFVPLDTIPPLSLVRGDLSFLTSAISDTASPLQHPNLLQTEEIRGIPLRVRPGEELSFRLYGSYTESPMYEIAAQRFNLDQQALPFVVTAFVNGDQVPVSADLPNSPVFGTIPQEESVVIPVTIKAPMEPGIYSYYVLYQVGPFVKQGELIPQSDGGVLYQQVARMPGLARSHQVVFEVVP
jgi:hypothetical protein